MSRVLVLPSPLLGPLAYEPLAVALRGRGHDVAVAALPVEPFSPGDALAAFVEQAAAGVSLLVPHSNAGLYVPAIAEFVGRAGGPAGRDPVLPDTVYVDAALPVPVGGDRTSLAPPALLDRIRSLADEHGVLPPWTRWWDKADIRPLFPADWFDRVDATAPRLPLGYFEATLPVPAGWEGGPAAYLGFGDTYAEEQAQASACGWPVVVREGHHLALLTDPDGTAETVAMLADNVSRRAAP